MALKMAPAPVLLLGDMNLTPWSPAFADLLQQTGLRDGRLGFGLLPTWPARWGVLGIPIDHALISPAVTIHQMEIGRDVGSDHRPLVIEFSVSGS